MHGITQTAAQAAETVALSGMAWHPALARTLHPAAVLHSPDRAVQTPRVVLQILGGAAATIDELTP
ncbi:MAG: hypothetical protein H0X38_09360 [Planctomycetes bacterium]|nr:hypothetical protein [Planctomycetota bacterium]